MKPDRAGWFLLRSAVQRSALQVPCIAEAVVSTVHMAHSGYTFTPYIFLHGRIQPHVCDRILKGDKANPMCSDGRR